MKDAITLTANGIKCDHCDYRDASVLLEDIGEWVDKPCPKCGSNLLTKADYDSVVQIQELVGMLNVLTPMVEDDDEYSTIGLEMNGTGSVKVKDDG